MVKNEELVYCPLCRQEMQCILQGLFDDRYGSPGWYSLARCRTCDLVRTVPALEESDLPGLYSAYYPRQNLDAPGLARYVTDVSTLRGRLWAWLTGSNNQGHYYARAGMKVLDYGCGTGISLLELRAIGAEGYGIEVDPNVAAVVEHWSVRIYIGSLQDSPFRGTKFDLISLNQVIEHVPDPGGLLRTLRAFLSDKGFLVLSFPNRDSIYRRLFGRQWINWHVPYHIHHFNRGSFAKLCEREGWKLVRWKTVTPNLWSLLQLRTLLVRARMGVPSPVWSPAPTGLRGDAGVSRRHPGAVSALLRRPARLVAKWVVAPCVAVLNRLIDAVGAGDSAVAFVEPGCRND